jgi:hypothetical protein
LKDKIINKIEKNIPWGIIGVLLTIIFGAIGIYTYFNQVKPNMQYEIVNESNVFDIHKPLKDLTILLKDEDIQKKDLNLKIYTIKISNNGYIDILQGHFDSNIIWGLKIDNGKIINKVRFIKSNSSYIKNELKITNSSNIVEFSKIILENDKFFSIELLVLHDKKVMPTIAPSGKIVGIEKILFIKDIKSKKKDTFLQRLFNDNFFINLIRFIVYFIIFIITILIFAFIENHFEKKKKDDKKKLIENILQISLNDKYEVQFFINIYEKNIKELEYIYRICSRQSKLLTNELDVIKKELHCKNEVNKLKKLSKLPSDIKYLINTLVDKEIIKTTDDNVEIDTQFKKNLEEILDYKKTNG